MNDKKACKSWNDSGEEIVISGIAGRFPNSDNMHQLRENLFNKVQLVREDHGRWEIEHPELPRRMGTINNAEKFDADFFGLSFEQAHALSTEARLLLERSYEAIIDAGINPKQLRGKNTAVIIAVPIVETQEKFLYENIQLGGLNVVGCIRSATANMLSYHLDLKGPSHTVDTACSSSLYTMAVAYDYIMSGKCEDAIIGAISMCYHPNVNLQFVRLGVLSSDGYCRPFDIAADGYSRSEAVGVAYVQKAKNAKRIYAICQSIKLNSDGFKEEGITYPSSNMQNTLLKECYDECGIPKSCLDYIETHGTATKVGDPQEVSAIQNFLCKNRDTPLMIGSVKSNLGHAEPASGFTQIAKVLIAFETGIVPPNINYTSPRKDIDALINGTVRVIEEPLPLKNGFIGINSFGFGGANAHMLLKWNPKQKIKNRVIDDDLPRLVILSGRTEESMKLFLNDIANNPVDIEYIRLLHDVYADNIDGHSWRGFTILNALQQDSVMEIRNCESMKRPVWFIFSALGSQWPGMGRNLLKFHVFANTIRQCDTILKPYGVSVTDILSKTDEKICKNALYAFVGIVAIQIGLVDVLTSLGITPNYMIGHSASELGCAYADECLTIEQTILSAYFIGLACVEKKNIIRSSMALVSRFNYQSLKNICPMDIEIVCRNNENSSVVCGPSESVQEFMKKLQLNNIHVKEIYGNVPYHSSYLASMKTQLLLNLNKIIPQPKKRSSKWISSSIPRTEWFTSASNLSSAAYHTHSILNTVLFEQTTHLIPTNAVTIEIAPDNVLQHVLKESLHSKVKNIVLNRRTEQNIEVILQGIGKLYNYGLQLQVANLYPPVEFPVSRGTPMISPSIRWDHSEDWFTPSYQVLKPTKSRERYVEVSLKQENFDFMDGHLIDGRILLPATGYLELVWQTIGMMKGKHYATIPIILQDIRFIRATHLSKTDSIELKIAIQEDGKFEITEGDSVVVTGTVYETSNSEQEMTSTDILSDNNEEEYMTARDIYKELKLRGYQYSGLFRGLHSASISCNKGHIIWKRNWITFMDSMLQMYVMGYDTKALLVPTSIDKIIINPTLHAWKLYNNRDVNDTTNIDPLVPIRIYRDIDTIISGGIEIRGFKATQISTRKLVQDVVIEENIFIAHHDHAKISLNEAIRISAQLVLEDHQITKVKVIELVEDVDDIASEYLSSSMLLEAFSDIPLIQANITLLTTPSRFSPADLSQNILIADLNKPSIDDEVLIIAGFNLLTKQKTSLERLLPFLKEGGYLITREKCDVYDCSKYLQQYKLNIILEKRTDKEMIVLMKKEVQIEKRIVVYVNNNNFNWLDELKLLVNPENKLDKKNRIILVGEGDFECGLLGFVNCLRKEPDGELVRGVLIQDNNASKFSLQDPFYVQQLQKDMTINVLRSNRTWGSYRHLRLPRTEANPVPSAHVCQMVRGDLSTLRWIENNVFVEYHREDLVRVVYAPLNFKDIMLASGKLIFNNEEISRERLHQYFTLGWEYVGFDANGQRVMGLRDTNCLTNIIVKDKDLCWKIPDAWTFEEAATVPCVYTTVYFALYIHGKMKKGNKILIHSGTGGIGQAAIHLALKEGCEVFTTVGTNDKRNFIKQLFPTILDEHIGNSRDTSFEQMIMRQTNGRGVDIVLNSLAEEKLIASVRCLAQNGRFLEIGKFDLLSNNPLSMFAFEKGISFHGIVLENTYCTDNHKNKPLLFKMIADGLKNGTIKPIQTKSFLKTEIEQAFRYMASGKHMGKIIINIQDESKSSDEPIIAYRRYYCLKDKSYIIVGGLGGFGLELTDWLIHRGARNIILISRTGIKNGYQHMKIRLWKKYGVNVLIVKNIDVADPKDCEYLLRTAEREAPVDAIYNLAVVLKDGVLENQTTETFADSFQSKAQATQNLDKHSRKICPKLRHFVVFSSVSCGRGNPGQTNYGMANSVMERVCEKRAEEGLPGLAIQWGAVGDVGLVADMQEDDKELIIGGTLQQKISCCLDELDKFLLQSRPIVSSMVVAEKKAGSSGHGSLIETVANILGIKDMKIISRNTSLAELGMDSMMTVEMKQTLEREFSVFLTAQEIRNLTFGKLSTMSSTNISDDNTQDKNLDAEEPDVIKFLVGVLKDEDFISETCFDLSTKRQNTMTEVFLIPGIDGSAAIFNYLAPNIKFSTTFLQYSTNNIDATNIISETTDRLTNHILPKLRDGKDFVMVGYSFGSIIAIEITRRLEAMNIKGRLVLIDGAPEQIRTLCKHITSDSNDANIQNIILSSVMEIYLSGTRKKMILELEKYNTWEEKYNNFAKQFLVTNTSLSPANLKMLCTTACKYSSIIRYYDPSTLPPIISPIILLKPTVEYPSYISVTEDYGLHKVTQNVVKVHYVEGNHVTILKNEKVSAAINGQSPFII